MAALLFVIYIAASRILSKSWLAAPRCRTLRLHGYAHQLLHLLISTATFNLSGLNLCIYLACALAPCARRHRTLWRRSFCLMCRVRVHSSM